ncbi:MAG: hypothetical protein SPL50_07750 [Alloprevotella sp.]|nr:hypothetical protein [Alloprevotella sp.]
MSKKKAYLSPASEVMVILSEGQLLGSSTEKNKNTYSNDGTGHIGMGTEKKSAIWGE